MSTPAQAFDHIVHIASGPMEMHTLQLAAEVNTGVTFNAGSLVTLNSSGKLVLGAGDADMPMWAINGTSDLDVVQESGVYAGGSNIIGGKVNCYVATGGYELFTSEYDSDAAASLLPNAKLAPGTGGEVTVSAALYNDKNVVGVVSRGVVTDQYGKGTLYFWPCFLPKVASTVSGTGATGASGATGATGATGPA